MIQRPQSLCLLVVNTALLIPLFFPLWCKQAQDVPYFYAEKTYYIHAWFLGEQSFGTGTYAIQWFPYCLVGLFFLLAVAIATYELIRYDNRALQIKLGIFNTAVIAVSIGLLLYLTLQEEKHLLPSVAGEYLRLSFLPAIALVSNLLANYFIKKDEALVKAANRMR